MDTLTHDGSELVADARAAVADDEVVVRPEAVGVSGPGIAALVVAPQGVGGIVVDVVVGGLVLRCPLD